jgi:hypothetical protein
MLWKRLQSLRKKKLKVSKEESDKGKENNCRFYKRPSYSSCIILEDSQRDV